MRHNDVEATTATTAAAAGHSAVAMLSCMVNLVSTDPVRRARAAVQAQQFGPAPTTSTDQVERPAAALPSPRGDRPGDSRNRALRPAPLR